MILMVCKVKKSCNIGAIHGGLGSHNNGKNSNNQLNSSSRKDQERPIDLSQINCLGIVIKLAKTALILLLLPLHHCNIEQERLPLPIQENRGFANQSKSIRSTEKSFSNPIDHWSIAYHPCQEEGLDQPWQQEERVFETCEEDPKWF